MYFFHIYIYISSVSKTWNQFVKRFKLPSQSPVNLFRSITRCIFIALPSGNSDSRALCSHLLPRWPSGGFPMDTYRRQSLLSLPNATFACNSVSNWHSRVALADRYLNLSRAAAIDLLVVRHRTIIAWWVWRQLKQRSAWLCEASRSDVVTPFSSRQWMRRCCYGGLCYKTAVGLGNT